MSLQTEMDYYETLREELERDHYMEWVIIRDEQVIDIHKNFHDAANHYERLYDGRPMVLKHIGFVPSMQKYDFVSVSPSA